MSTTEQNKKFVVLLHGILRNKLDMFPLEKYLESKGYVVLNILYPSRELSLEDISAFVDKKIQTCPSYNKNMTLNFVTHSMGGLIARYYIDTHKPENIGNVVMLGPPNAGSEFADWLSDVKIFSPLYKAIYGPAGSQLRTDYVHKDKINYPLGVIAGNASINPLAPWILPGDHDGIVTVERTKIEGMTDHITMNSTHTFMMFSPEVMSQVHEFLLHGKFNHTDKDTLKR